MSKLNVLNINGEKVKDITLNKEIFGIEPNDAVLYDAIKLAQNNARQGTRGVKGRSDVSGGGRKPWRQKGTGRARQGSTRAPHWYHGGWAFGNQTRNYEVKQNRKERALALKSALSYKVLDSELKVLNPTYSQKTYDFLRRLPNYLKYVDGCVDIQEDKELKESLKTIIKYYKSKYVTYAPRRKEQ